MPSPHKSACESGHGYAAGLAAAAFGAATVLMLSLVACTSRPPATRQENRAPSASTAGAVEASPSASASAKAETPSTENPAPTPDQSIAELQQIDPGSPDALSGHLEYADQLVSAHDEDCQKRLNLAQSELDMASTDPSFNVVLPLGGARLADLQYRIHAARAACKAAAPQRETELQQALASAQQAVDLYRDALDYESMTIAQFNVAVTQRLLGDNGASVASLEAAVALDKEFGLHQDAGDNARLLARWRGAADTAAADFPTRTVTLKSWQPRDAQMSVQVDEAIVVGGNVTRYRAQRTFTQHVGRELGSWVVSHEPGTIEYDVAPWPPEAADVRDLALSFERALTMPSFAVGQKGGFAAVPGVLRVSTRQIAAARTLMRAHMDPQQLHARLDWRESPVLEQGLAPLAIQTVAAENYNLQVGMWLGATLEQGVWYKLAAPLTLPVARQVVLPNDIEFAYTRDVPCTAAATQHSCVEIVVHAKPQEAAVKDLIEDSYYPFVKSDQERLHYWSATYIRIVTDPETLAIRVYDVRRYWHVSDKKATREPMENRFERVVTTFDYP